MNAMIRVLLSLALIALASTSASAKPKIAILGIEVTGMVDQAATNVARDLTEGMRQRAKSGGGPFALAPNSDRELIDEKVIKQCDSEEASCMSEIGKDIDTDVLVYGKLEKDGGGFQATIVMLDVKKRTTIKTTFIAIAPGASTEEVRTVAKKTYLELAPTLSGGAKLVISANVESGSVFVDGDLRETLSDGHATLTLPEGRYRIGVESDGYKRKEIKVVLVDDESTTETFELSKKGSGSSKRSGFDPWKPIFGVTAAAALGLGGYSTVAFILSRNPSLTKEESAAIMARTPGKIDQEDCVGENLTNNDTGTNFKNACKWHKTHIRYLYPAIGVGAVAIVAGYFAFFHGSKKEPSSTSARGRSPKRSIAITPTLSPEGGGATLHIEW